MCKTCLFSLALALMASAHAAVTVVDQRVRSAGCYIASEVGVVMTIGRLNGALQLPAGTREGGESPACTARRETLEETGLVVQVAEAVVVSDSGRFVLFRCIPDQRLQAGAEFKALDFFEVREVLLVNPLTMLTADGAPVESDWRFPEDHGMLVALFRRGEPDEPAIRTGLECAGSS